MIDAYGIHLGPLYIHFYALLLMTGMGVGAWLTARRAEIYGLDSQHVWDGLMWAIIPGLIGARIYHILTPSPDSGLSFDYYMQNPLQMLAIWNGGLGIYGAIVGGAIGVIIYGRRHKQPLLRWFDIVAPSVALAQAIGRWGNFVNQELYGAPTDLPWGIYIPPEKRSPRFAQYDHFHPLFFYEFLWNLGACLILIYIHRRYKDKLLTGDIFLLYIMQYPVIRFLLDFLRLDSNMTTLPITLTTAQLVSVVVFVVTLGIFIARHLRNRAKPTETAATQPPAEK